jgi:hypothetical protein
MLYDILTMEFTINKSQLSNDAVVETMSNYHVRTPNEISECLNDDSGSLRVEEEFWSIL